MDAFSKNIKKLVVCTFSIFRTLLVSTPYFKNFKLYILSKFILKCNHFTFDGNIIEDNSKQQFLYEKIGYFQTIYNKNGNVIGSATFPPIEDLLIIKLCHF